MTVRMMAAALAATSLLFLGACGGGGGGGSPSTTMAPSTVTEFRNAVRSDIYGQIGGAQVSFGSTVIATGAKVTRVDSTFSTARATATMSRGSSAAIQLDSADAEYDSGVQASLVDLPNRRSRTRDTFDHTTSSATLGLLAVDWSDTDTSDYLAGGYWLHIEADPFSLQIGAFTDGPELDLNNPPTLPISGTASYRGSASGMYASESGTDVAGVPAGSEEYGKFFGVATLNADFGAGTISGCVGCVEDILLSGDYYDKATGDVSAFENVPSAYRLSLGAVSFDRAAGTFQGSNVTLSHALLPGMHSSGTWAGQFSNRSNSAGNPRVVAGTFGGESSTPGGSKVVFIGAFAAGSR